MARELPSGTVTLLFTDIVGSTRLLQELGRERYVRALTEHRRLLREAFASHGGVEVEMQGDSFHFAFHYARDAVAAAAAGQRALVQHEWEAEPIRVRIGLHTGEPMQADGLYAGLDVHRAARVMSVGHGGQVVVSERTADLVEGELPPGVSLRDLGEHRLKDLSLPQRLYDLFVDGLPSEFPPPKTLENRPTNLPVQPTPLVGRVAELREVRGALRRAEVRLLTLTGPGGTGKTRLALHAAAELVEEFGEGVFCAFLAPLRDPALLLGLVAHTLGVRERPDEELEDTLAAYLRERELLLVVDNFEHLVEAAPALGRLIARCEGLKLLVTSRAPLHLAGEHELPVPPLSLPGPEELPEADAVTQYEAVQLFVQRAQAVKPSFLVTNENAAAVAAICVRLDGLPLALELAAARIRLLSPQALLGRLGHALGLLSGGTIDSDERQRTLRATIAWSHELLSSAEQTLFVRLAVFAGGFRIEAAEQVCNPDAEVGLDTLDCLASLLEKSLLRQRDDPDGEPRFWMLETIREYAGQQLGESDEAEELRRRHAQACIALAEQAAPELKGGEQLEWLDRLDREHDNFRSALAWAVEQDELELAVALGSRLGLFWWLRGHATEGRRWLRRVLAVQRGDTSARGTALYWMATLAHDQGDHGEAKTLLAQAIRQLRAAGDDGGVALALTSQAWAAALVDGDPRRSEELARQGLELARASGDRWVEAEALNQIAGALSERGEHASALATYHESLAISRALGDNASVVITLLNIGWDAVLRENYSESLVPLQEALRLARSSGDKRAPCVALCNLGFATLGRGDALDAERLFRESIQLAAELRYKRVAVECLEGLAGAAAAQGRPRRAARLWGASDALLGSLQLPLVAPETALRAQHQASVATALGTDVFATCVAAGSLLSFDAAVSCAVEQS